MTCLKCRESFRPILARGLCSPCYQDVTRRGELEAWPKIRARRVTVIVCRVCSREMPHAARGLCKGCTSRFYRSGGIGRFSGSGKGHRLVGVDVVDVKEMS